MHCRHQSRNGQRSHWEQRVRGNWYQKWWNWCWVLSDPALDLTLEKNDIAMSMHCCFNCHDLINLYHNLTTVIWGCRMQIVYPMEVCKNIQQWPTPLRLWDDFAHLSPQNTSLHVQSIDSIFPFSHKMCFFFGSRPWSPKTMALPIMITGVGFLILWLQIVHIFHSLAGSVVLVVTTLKGPGPALV